MDAAQRAEAGHPPAAAELDVVAAREIELLVVAPPRHVEMRSARAVFVVRHAVHHLRDEAANAGAGRVGEVLADDAARVAEALRKARRLRVEQQPRGFAGARRQHHDPPAHVILAAGGLVDVADAARQAGLVNGDFARHGVGGDRQASGRERRRQQYRGRREIGMRGTAAPALAAVMTRRPAVQRLRQDREPDRDAPDVQALRGLLDQQLVAARLRRRLEDAVRIVGQPFIRSEEADVSVDAVVVGLEVVVGDRPVVAEAVEALASEIVRPEAERNAAPVIGAAAEHARAEPVESIAGRRRVWLTFERPAAPAGVELAELALGNRQASPRRLVRPRHHLRVAARVEHHAGFEHQDVRAGFGQHLRGHAAARARANDDNVVNGAIADDLHEPVRRL